jgi:hypothetical protein
MIGGMDSVLEALNAPDRAISHLIEDCAASWSDLMDIGLTDYTARKRVHSASPRPLAPSEVTRIQPVGLPDTVALVPVNDLGRRYLRHDVYIRDAQLRDQLRLRTTHIGWSDNGRIEVVRPITQRWRIGSAAAIPSLPITNVSAITSEPDLQSVWRGPATLVELGAPIAVGLPLGFRPNSSGATAAIPRVRYVLLSDLLMAARTGGTLLGLATV